MSVKVTAPDALVEARKSLNQSLPSAHPSPEQWQEFHARSAETYLQVAQTDPRHRHEALALAAAEQENADALAGIITAQPTQGQVGSTT